MPVFDELVLLQPSSLGTFIVTVAGITSHEAEHLVEKAGEDELEVEDWTTQIQWLCSACSEGRVEHTHDDMTTRSQRRFGVAARSEVQVRRFMAKMLELSSGATLQTVECAIAPTQVQ